jgi:glycine oxidase
MTALIVGAGVMGCSVAWKLALRGIEVTVLERAIPGAEASSAAAGILAPLAESGRPGPLLDLGLASLDRYPAWAEALGDIGFHRGGVVHAALDDAGIAAHDGLIAALAGYDVERVGPAEAADRWPYLAPVRDALWMPTEASVDNRLLVCALHRAAERAGARFVTGRTVGGVAFAGGRAVGVDTDAGRIEASDVVICAGAWTGLVGGVPVTVQPIRGQMLMVKAPVRPFEPVLFAVGRGYLVPRADGRVIVGSTMEDVGFTKAVTPAGLAHLVRVCELVPSLADHPVVETWAGLRPARELPAIGAVSPGLWVASGHHRNGILLTPITAELLVAQLLGDPSPVDPRPFAP